MNIFSGQSPKAVEIRAKINPWDLIKTEKLLHSKGNQKENKKTTFRMGEKFQMMQWTRALSLGYTSNLHNPTAKKPINQWKNGQKT